MILNKTLPWLVVAIVFLILLTPLIVSSSLLFPFITGKAFFFRVVSEVALGLWLVLIWLRAEYRPRRSVILWSLVSLVAITFLATIFGVNHYRSFWSNYERMDGLINLLHLLAYFLVIGSVLNTEKLWRWFFTSSVGISVAVGFYSILQLAGKLVVHQSDTRLDATLGNSIYLAVYMLFHIFITLWLLVQHRGNKWWRYVYGLIILLQVIVLYYTATRGAILGCLGGALLTALLLTVLAKGHYRVRKIAVGVLVALVLVIGGFWLMRDSNFVKQSQVLSRFASISATDTTTASRLTIWSMALRGFSEHPVLGWGPENFMTVFAKYYEPKLWRQEPWFDRSHNIFLDWLIDAGALGLLAYLSLFVGALYYLWRRKSPFTLLESSLFTGLLAAYLFHNIFVFDNLISYLSFLSVLAYLVHRSVPVPAVPSKPTSQSGNFWFQISILIIAGLLLVVIYEANAKPLLASSTLIRALSVASANDKITLFQQALNYNTFGNNEIREQLVAATQVALASDKVTVADKQKFFALATTEMAKQVSRFPADARSRLLFGSLLSLGGQTDQAIDQLERARQLSPQKQQILFELAQAYFTKGDRRHALELAQRAYQEDPSYDLALQVLINALVANKQFSTLPSLWATQVANQPTNLQNWISWAAAEFKVGHKSRAIEILSQAEEKFPEATTDINKWIADIKAGRDVLAP